MINPALTELVDELYYINEDIDYYQNLKKILGFCEENVAKIDTMIATSLSRQARLTKQLSAILQ